MVAAQFLRNLIAEVPDAIHTVLIDNGIEHRLTRITQPWTNEQVKRMNRTIKEATVKRFHYDSHDQLRRTLQNFIHAYNFGRRLKTLKGLTPYELICKQRTSGQDRFIIDPIHQRPGPDIPAPAGGHGSTIRLLSHRAGSRHAISGADRRRRQHNPFSRKATGPAAR